MGLFVGFFAWFVELVDAGCLELGLVGYGFFFVSRTRDEIGEVFLSLRFL